MPSILIIGATRGLGASLANAYATQPNTTVYGTTRAAVGPKGLNEKIAWVPNIDVSDSGVGPRLVNQLGGLGVAGGMVEGKNEVRGFDVVVRLTPPPSSLGSQSCDNLAPQHNTRMVELIVHAWQIITAGYFATEDFVNGPKWEEEVKMYSKSHSPEPPHKTILIPYSSNISHLPALHRPLPIPRTLHFQRIESPPHILRIRIHNPSTPKRGRRKLRTSCQQIGIEYGRQVAEYGCEGERNHYQHFTSGIYEDGNDCWCGI